MQARSVAELVKAIQEPIVHLAETGCQFDASQPQHKMRLLLQAIKAKLSFQKLLELLEEQAKNQEPLSPVTVMPFYQFLAMRWQKIQKTDSAYPMAPNIPINRACRLLAEQIAPVESKHPFSLLMPTVNFTRYPEKLHQIIISSNNRALHIVDCFQYLEKREMKLSRANSRQSRSLGRSNNSSSDLIILDINDEQLITSHSQLASNYANEIVLQRNLEETRAAFLKALDSDDYVVSASYGEDGKIRLLEVLLHNLHGPIAISTFLFMHVPKTEWIPFLELLDNDSLFSRILLIDLPGMRKASDNNDDAFKAEWQAKTEEQLLRLSNAKFSFKQDDELRALLICILMVYKTCRKESPEHKTSYGGFAGRLFGGLVPSREQKLEACDFYCNYILAEPKQSLDWEHLQKSPGFAKHQASLTGSSVLPKIAALGDRLYKAMRTENVKQTQYGTIAIYHQ